MYCSTARVASKPFTAKRAANFDRRMSSSRVQAQPQKATLEQKRALIESVDCFIFDCDGVIWKGDKLIEGVPETLDFLREQGSPSLVRFVLFGEDALRTFRQALGELE